MKIKSIYAHTFTLAVGAGLTASYFIFSVLPATTQYIPATDVKFIQLSSSDEPKVYTDVLKKRYLAAMFATSPFYFFKRDDAHKIESKLAKQGYSLSTDTIFTSYFLKAYDLRIDEATRKENFDKAYDWANIASRQGFYQPMLIMIKNLNLGGTKDITKELELIENYAKISSIGGPASSLSKYYEKIGYTVKADDWAEIAKSINAEDRPEPACTTITPWRGY